MEDAMAITMTHTPGPWTVDLGARDLVRNATNGERIAKVHGGLTYDETVANARLIAAAPDLLKLLREVMDVVEVVLDDESEMDTWLDHARAAIAKVEGR
jgi:hypothetical protein